MKPFLVLVLVSLALVASFLKGSAPYDLGDLIAAAALLFSFSVWGQGEDLREEGKRLTALAGNGALLASSWSHLAKNPRLLRFHGLTTEILAEKGFDQKDLAYLLGVFEAASFYYEHIEIGKKHEVFEEQSLRYRILESSDTQRAWEFLKPFFSADEIYISRVDATINHIQKKKPS